MLAFPRALTLAVANCFTAVLLAVVSAAALPLAQADEVFIPRQSQPLGPPLSPQQALAKLVVPAGFHVELVAAEPDLVNPVEEVEEIRDNQHSLMPEGLEAQMTQQEMAVLFALLSLEQPPEAADNQVIAGTPERLHEQP